MFWRIELIESERGWGQNYWYEHYDTLEDANRRITALNEKYGQNDIVPDYYCLVRSMPVKVEKIEGHPLERFNTKVKAFYNEGET